MSAQGWSWNRKAGSRDGAGEGFAPGSRTRRRTLGLLVLALLAIAAVLAPSASAQGTGVTEATCEHVKWTFTGFPEAENNQVTEIISVNGVKVYEETFTFNGPEFSNTVPISVPPQKDKIDAHAKWNTNGDKGTFDHAKTLLCEKPSFTMEKLQMIEGSGEPFTTQELLALIGEKVNYEIRVKNTGNVPLTFVNFVDTHCDGGTISGGPGVSEVLPGETTVYTCSHVLTIQGQYINYATVEGDPPPGHGKAKKGKTNVVVVRSLSRPAYATCTHVTFFYRGFPNLPNNTVTQIIAIDGVVVYEGTFTFNGPSGMDVIEVTVPPGKHKVDAHAKWNTNGYKSSYDVATPVNCE
jgi:uncharacterized repeat protein (TIGR01451 family)